jgi:hypothetical protein
VTPFDVWRGGLTLAEAVEGTEAGRRWAEMRARVLADCHRLHNDPRLPLFDRIESTLWAQRLAADWEEQIRLLDEAREVVRNCLSSGKLFGCGFVGCGNQPQQLAVVPPETWRDEAHIDWDLGRVRTKGSVFSDVRVVPRPQETLFDNSKAKAVGWRLDD